MPHIIMEYSAELAPSFDVLATLRAMHHAVGAHESVDMQRVKSRAVPLHHVKIGDSPEPCALVHITIKVLPGRDDAVLTSFTQQCLDIATQALNGAEKTAVSAETRTIYGASYVAGYAGG